MTTYSINDLEKITGIKAHTIRIWEKRYEIISPRRTSTNIRYYQDSDLKKLLNISILNRHGFRISDIARMQSDEINEKILEISGKSNDYESQINNLIVAMTELDELSFSKVLSNATLKLGFEKTVTHILYPFLDKIGILWQIGTINPAQEHFVSNLIRQKLIIAIDAQEMMLKEDSKTFLLFLPENELHELGLLFYCYMLKKNGHEVIYLGQSVPYRDLLEIMKIRHADYMLTYFVSALTTQEIQEYLQRLSGDFPSVSIYITGMQLQQANLELPSNIFAIPHASDFKEKIKKL